uniref:uncharacterized protein LOC120346083 isoform X2 n=1 Tax=Styela clava TaxID=7725 RepID=UPI00193978CB|nr:uncharacterized protein LOC120346083 isoform X2 [Styela clava]
MDSSMLPKDSRGLAQQKCLPPSILKISTSDLACEGNNTQKKTVKFHIPFKETVQSKPEQQETVDGDMKKPPILETNSIEAIPHAGFDVDMTDIFEESQGVDTEATQNIDEAFSGDSLRTSNIVTSSFLQRESGKNPVLIPPSLPTNKISVIQTRVPKQVHTDDNMEVDCPSLESWMSSADKTPFMSKTQTALQSHTRVTMPIQKANQLSTKPPYSAAQYNHNSEALEKPNLMSLLSRTPKAIVTVPITVSQKAFQQETTIPAFHSELPTSSAELMDVPEMMRKEIIRPGRDVLQYKGQVSYNGKNLIDICQSAGGDCTFQPLEAKRTNTISRIVSSISTNKSPQAALPVRNSQVFNQESSNVREWLQPDTFMNTSSEVISVIKNTSLGQSLQKPLKIQKVLLVQDEELFPIRRIFPHNTWENLDEAIPNNLNEFFVW